MFSSRLRNPIVSRFIAGALALTLPIALSGCRFGNHVEQPSNDTLRYYETAPTALSFTASMTNANDPNQLDTVTRTATTDNVPSLITQFVTNPVAFVYTDATHAHAGLTNPRGDGSVALIVDMNGGLFTSHAFGDGTLWADAACTFRVDLVTTNGILGSPGPLTTGSSLDLMGRISMNIRVVYELFGDCQPSLASMHGCINNFFPCSDDNKAYVNQFFGEHIESGAMTNDDILRVRTFSYDVTYQ